MNEGLKLEIMIFEQLNIYCVFLALIRIVPGLKNIFNLLYDVLLVYSPNRLFNSQDTLIKKIFSRCFEV